MRLVIIGRTGILYETVRGLREPGHEIAGIVTARAAPEYNRSEKDFESLAAELGVPFLLTQTLETAEFKKMCENADLGVSLNWVSIVGESSINLFRRGILNVHAGNLPAYRGNACPNWVILAGEIRITVSVHFMEGGELDCGRVVGQDSFDMGEDTRINEVYAWLEKSVPALYQTTIDRLEEEPDFSLYRADPDSEGSFRCFPRQPWDGFVDWNNSVLNLHRLVRASGPPFSGAYTFVDQGDRVRKLVLLNSRVVASSTPDRAVSGQIVKNDPDSGESWVRCADGILSILECRYEDESASFLPGRKWTSIRMRLGVRPEDMMWRILNRGSGPADVGGRYSK